MYQYNDRLTQLFTKYKYIWLWLQCFDPLLGYHQAYIIKGRNIVAKAKYIYTWQRVVLDDHYTDTQDLINTQRNGPKRF
jgi:hypothetical protein